MKKTLKILGILMASIVLLSTLAFAVEKKIEHNRKTALIALCDEFNPGMARVEVEEIILARYPGARQLPLVFEPRRHTPELTAAPVELVPWTYEEKRVGPFLLYKHERNGATVESTIDGRIYDLFVYDDTDLHMSVEILGRWHKLPFLGYKFDVETYATDNCSMKS